MTVFIGERRGRVRHVAVRSARSGYVSVCGRMTLGAFTRTDAGWWWTDQDTSYSPRSNSYEARSMRYLQGKPVCKACAARVREMHLSVNVWSEFDEQTHRQNFVDGLTRTVEERLGAFCYLMRNP